MRAETLTWWTPEDRLPDAGVLVLPARRRDVHAARPAGVGGAGRCCSGGSGA